MAIAIIIRVTIRGRSVAAVVSVTNKVKAIGDLAARTKASTKRGVKIVDAAVDNANTDTPSGDTLFVELVYPRHDVDGLSISSASRKGWVIDTSKDNALLWHGAWKEGDGGNSDNAVGVCQMDEVLVAFERKRSTNKEFVVVLFSNIDVDAAGDKIFVEIAVGLEQPVSERSLAGERNRRTLAERLPERLAEPTALGSNSTMNAPGMVGLVVFRGTLERSITAATRLNEAKAAKRGAVTGPFILK